MNPAEFPNAYKYAEMVRLRDTGALFVLILAALVLWWLVQTRFTTPKLLAASRHWLIVLYYLSLALLLIRGLLL